MRVWSFAKGHGTLNDFVILKDRNGILNPSAADVRFLCDRRAGVGADGLLRAVKAGLIPGWSGDPDLWFMDYRNADGSIAEMCGNGLRVFVRYLVDGHHLVAGSRIEIATRAGVRTASVLPDGRITVTMGQAERHAGVVEVAQSGRDWQAVSVNVGNPHAVVLLDEKFDLATLDLSTPPKLSPEQFPEGANVEYVVPRGELHVGMRVWERGVGETMSCGTGTVAAALAYALDRGVPIGRYRVDVPGGKVEVSLMNGEALLTGPAVIVAHGEVAMPE